MYDVFISHSSKDKEIAHLITEKLEKEGLISWIAPRNIRPGMRYAQEIIFGIENSEVFLLLVSKDSIVSDPVDREIEIAFNRKKLIIPFIIDDSDITGSLEYYLMSLHWIRADKSLENSIQKVTTYLVNLIKQSENLILPETVFVKSGNFPFRTGKEVTLTYDFLIGKYPITFEEYDRFCDDIDVTKPDDLYFGRGRRPVVNVNWWSCLQYCNWLSKQSNFPIAYDQNGFLLDENGEITEDITKVKGYRLPTEVEWYYAAKGGCENIKHDYLYSGSNKIDRVGWYWKNSGDKELSGYRDERKIRLNNCRAHEVGEKKANDLGIYDMSGNVWEWCYDKYSEEQFSIQEINPFTYSNDLDNSIRIEKGGSFTGNPEYSGIDYCGKYESKSKRKNLGFRVARTKVDQNMRTKPR